MRKKRTGVDDFLICYGMAMVCLDLLFEGANRFGRVNIYLDGELEIAGDGCTGWNT